MEGLVALLAVPERRFLVDGVRANDAVLSAFGEGLHEEGTLLGQVLMQFQEVGEGVGDDCFTAVALSAGPDGLKLIFRLLFVLILANHLCGRATNSEFLFAPGSPFTLIVQVSLSHIPDALAGTFVRCLHHKVILLPLLTLLLLLILEEVLPQRLTWASHSLATSIPTAAALVICLRATPASLVFQVPAAGTTAMEI